MSEYSESSRGFWRCTGQEALWVVRVQEKDPEALLPCVLIEGLEGSREPTHTWQALCLQLEFELCRCRGYLRQYSVLECFLLRLGAARCLETLLLRDFSFQKGVRMSLSAMADREAYQFCQFEGKTIMGHQCEAA